MNAGLVLAGGALQIVGIACAAFGIRKLRKNWTTLPGLLRRSQTFMERVFNPLFNAVAGFFHRHRKSVPANLTAKVASQSGMSASLTREVTRAPEPESLTAILEWLTSRVNDLTSNQTILNDDLSATKTQQEEQIKRIDTDLIRIQSDFKSKLTNLAAGGLEIQTWGVFFLIAGTVILVWGSLVR